MQAKVIAVAGIAIALGGIGVWLARSSTSRAADSVAPSAKAAAPEPPSKPPRRAGPGIARPALPARAKDSSMPGLAADLVDSDPKVRRAAVREVVRDHDADPALLLAASRDADLEVGVVATEALGRLHAQGQVSAADLIARVTDRSLDERVRVSALNGLGLVSSAEAARLLGELAAGADVGERRGAAILLVHQEPAAAMPVLIGLLADADEYVRSNALESLRARSRGRDFGMAPAAWRTWWQARSR